MGLKTYIKSKIIYKLVHKLYKPFKDNKYRRLPINKEKDFLYTSSNIKTDKFNYIKILNIVL